MLRKALVCLIVTGSIHAGAASIACRIEVMDTSVQPAKKLARERVDKPIEKQVTEDIKVEGHTVRVHLDPAMRTIDYLEIASDNGASRFYALDNLSMAHGVYANAEARREIEAFCLTRND